MKKDVFLFLTSCWTICTITSTTTTLLSRPEDILTLSSISLILLVIIVAIIRRWHRLHVLRKEIKVEVEPLPERLEEPSLRTLRRVRPNVVDPCHCPRPGNVADLWSAGWDPMQVVELPEETSH